MLLHLSLSTLLVAKCMNNVLIGLPDLAIEKRDKSKITKYLIFPICLCQRETFYIFFTNLINSKLISELVSSGNTVILCINATQV